MIGGMGGAYHETKDHARFLVCVGDEHLACYCCEVFGDVVVNH